MKHREHHKLENVGWLHAAVLGANDGIVSASSLIPGVAVPPATHASILLRTLQHHWALHQHWQTCLSLKPVNRP